MLSYMLTNHCPIFTTFRSAKTNGNHALSEEDDSVIVDDKKNNNTENKSSASLAEKSHQMKEHDATRDRYIFNIYLPRMFCR